MRENTTESVTTSTSSAVKYDLIGKLTEATKLTRQTIARILQGLLAARFSQYRINPENFVMEATKLINEQKATLIVEHITMDKGHLIACLLRLGMAVISALMMALIKEKRP